MDSTHQRIVMLGGVLLGAIACATSDSAEPQPGSGARSPAVVAASPPLPGFGPSDPAGRIPGVIPATRGRSAASLGLITAADTARSRDSASTAATRSASDTAKPTTSRPGTPAMLAEGEISAASGIFTAEQAERGREVYTSSCARCHMSTQHSGGTFANTWHNRRVSELYELLYSTMPVDAPGSLSAQQYIDVVAYMLQLNGHPTGTTVLPTELAPLRRIRIDIRSTAGLQ